jgi:ubiquinone/menaquinone biosynthesis C-methylase UbiE
MEIYDKIGLPYKITRKADERIGRIVEELLNLKNNYADLADIGAGTGNYSEYFDSKGYNLTAIEPSEVMINQSSSKSRVKWIKCNAESISLPTESFDGLFSILAIHHFKNVERALMNMNYILKSDASGVIFAADPELVDKQSWIYDYFRIIFEKSRKIYLPLLELKNLIENVSNSNVTIKEFFLPDDLNDKFFVAGWKNPYLYLNEQFRAGISPLASLDSSVLNPILKRLEKDLKNGVWKEKYGSIQQKNFFDGGYRFLAWKKL